jgi:hypothetical protein
MGIVILILLLTVPGLWCYTFLSEEGKHSFCSSGKWAFVLGASIIITTLLFIGLMLLGIFSLTIIAILYGLLMAVYLVKYRTKVLPFFRETISNMKANTLVFAMAVMILLLSTVFFYQPTEYLFGGRDPGVYVNTAVQIGQNNQIKRLNPLIDEVLSKYPGVFEDRSLKYPAFYLETSQGETHINPQFFHAYSIWLGVAYKLFGLNGFLYITPLIASISLLMIYTVAKELFNKWTGLITILLLSINISQIWFARGPYTEILSQLVLWYSMFIIIKAYQSKDGLLGFLSGLSMGASILVRLDNIFFLPAIALFLILAYLRKEGSSTAWANMTITGFFCSFLFSGPYIMIYGKEYTHFQLIRDTPLPDFLSLPSLFAILLIIGVVLLFFLFLIRKPLMRLLDVIKRYRRFLAAILGIVTIVLFIYLYFIRPETLTPNLKATGGRSYREETLVRLGWYLTRVGIFFSMAGFVYFLQTRFKKEHTLLLFMILINFSLYLYDPRITPDQFWAVRRHIPFIIPTLVIFLSYAAYSLRKIKLRSIQPWIPTAIVVVYFGTKFLIAASPFLFHTEFAGVGEGLKTLSRQFEPKSIVITDHFNYSDGLVGTPMEFIYNKNVMVLKNDYDTDNFKQFIMDKAKEGTPLYLLVNNSYQNMQKPDISYKFIDQVSISYAAAVPSELKRPDEVAQNIQSYNIYEPVPTNIYLNQLYLDVGTPADINYEYNGFYNQEMEGTVAYRWGQGKASIRMLIDFGMINPKKGYKLNIRAKRLMPDQLKDPNLYVAMNGTPVGSLPLNDTMSDYSLNFPGNLFGKDGVIFLEFETKAFSPKELGISPDARDLGFMLDSIEFVETDEEATKKE